MKNHWRYLLYVLKHKYYVFVEGRKLGIGIWQLLVHDLSKFSPYEWGAYVQRFFSDDPANPERFERAWLHHVHKNPHHTQHWIIDGEPVRIPFKFVREIVADWEAMGRNFGNIAADWYARNKDRMTIHHDSRVHIELLLLMKKDAEHGT